MTRHVFTLRVAAGHLEEYRRRHAHVWPEMLLALRDAGWASYTLHLRDDGLLVGVVETDDLDAAVAAMDATEVNGRWQASMAPLFADLPEGRPDTALAVLPTIFDIEVQLAALPRPP